MADFSIQTAAIDHVVLYVRDVARSRAFYEGVLGMTVRSAGEHHAFLRCGTQQIGLFETDDEAALSTHGQLNHLAFSIIGGTREEIVGTLKSNGVAVRGRRGDPECVYFDDPDGHTLQLMVES